MTNEGTIKEIKKLDDRISREALMQKLNAWDSRVHGIPNYAWKVIRELPPVEESSIHIPSGATNGDVIKAVFGAEFIRNTLYGVVIDLDGEIELSDDWWFAPYREGDKNE